MDWLGIVAIIMGVSFVANFLGTVFTNEEDNKLIYGAIGHAANTWILTSVYDRHQNWLLELLYLAREFSFIPFWVWFTLFPLTFLTAYVCRNIQAPFDDKAAFMFAEPIADILQQVAAAVIVGQEFWCIGNVSIAYSRTEASLSGAVYAVYFIAALAVAREVSATLGYFGPPILTFVRSIRVIFLAYYPYAAKSKTLTRLASVKVVSQQPQRSRSTDTDITILAVSDTHIPSTDGFIISNISNRPWSVTERYTKAVTRCTKYDLIIHCGDVTDTGSSHGWFSAQEIVGPMRSPVLIVPGNHDANFSRFNRDEYGYHYGDGQELDEENKRQYLYGRLFGLDRRSSNVDKDFPIVRAFANGSLVVVGLDSNRRASHHLATNAFGYVGSDQLEKAREKLKALPTGKAHLVVVLHHHVLVPDIDARSFWSYPFLRCIDADEVLNFASEHQAKLILHGHKHMPYVATIAKGGHDLTVVSCGSMHHDAVGPCAADAEGPSCYKITITADGEVFSELIRDLQGPLPEQGHKQSKFDG